MGKATKKIVSSLSPSVPHSFSGVPASVSVAGCTDAMAEEKVTRAANSLGGLRIVVAPHPKLWDTWVCRGDALEWGCLVPLTLSCLV